MSMNGDLPGLSKRTSGFIGSCQYKTFRSTADPEVAGPDAGIPTWPAEEFRPRENAPPAITRAAATAMTESCKRLIARLLETGVRRQAGPGSWQGHVAEQ